MFTFFIKSAVCLQFITINISWTWVTFSVLTVCIDDITNYPLLGNCNGNATNFLNGVKNCLENDPKFNITKFTESMEQKSVTDYVVNTAVSYNKNEENTFNLLNEEILHAVYYESFGLCYSLDLTNDITEITNSDYELVLNFTKNDKLQWMIVMLHTKNDLPDAIQSHPKIFLQPSKGM